jgi:ribonuclease P protein component
MLNRMFRISRSEDYQHTYRNGLKVPGKYLIAYISANNLDQNRFGIVASKKVGNAVKRNRAKRCLRAIARESQAKLSPGHDIVIIARKSTVEAEYNRLEKDFYTVMKKARLC